MKGFFTLSNFGFGVLLLYNIFEYGEDLETIEWVLTILAILTIYFNVYYLLSNSESNKTWFQYFFERKALEEKDKIQKIKNKNNS